MSTTKTFSEDAVADFFEDNFRTLRAAKLSRSIRTLCDEMVREEREAARLELAQVATGELAHD